MYKRCKFISFNMCLLSFSANKLKEGWSKFVDKMKSKKARKKKMKKMEQELMFRIMANQGDLSNEDDISSREGSIHSHQESDRVSRLQIMHYIVYQRGQFVKHDRFIDSVFCFLSKQHQEDSDLEDYLTSVQEDMMGFKLSYEMWRVGCWTVSIPHVSYKYQCQCGMSWRLVISLRRCKILSLEWYVNV